MVFTCTEHPIEPALLIQRLSCPQAGALVTFAGWVRDHNEGQSVSSLEYQIYPELALKEGGRILDQAQQNFGLHGAIAVHRQGHLQIGEIAVWVGTAASHRHQAFSANRYIIDQIKLCLPIWKKEYYHHQPPQWVYCAHPPAQVTSGALIDTIPH